MVEKIEEIRGKILTKDDIIFSMTVTRGNHMNVVAPEIAPETSIQLLLNAIVNILFAAFERSRIVKL